MKRSAQALVMEMDRSPEFMQAVETMVPGTRQALIDNPTYSPPGWVWNHAHSSTAFNAATGQYRLGVMQLVPEAQHTPGTAAYRLMHPGPGFSGGYREWAVPSGAPPR